MLLQLNIKNFALIEEMTVEFGSGFNILSGETGAGKSILIDTIDYVLGGKFSKDLIRHGESKTIVEAVFSIENEEVNDVLDSFDIEKDDLLIILRETTSSGKSIIKVNGRSVVIAQLKKIREKLMDIHGQHQNQNLLHKSNQIFYLDSYCGEKLEKKLEEFTILRDEYNIIQDKIEQLNGNADRERLLDYLTFQIQDIESADLKLGEEESLKESYNILSNSEKISKAMGSSISMLKGNEGGSSIIEGLSRVVSDLTSVENHFEKIKEKRTQIEEAFYIIEDAANELRDLANEVYFDDNELSKINERIYQISIYKKKYGNSIEEILTNLESLKTRYDELRNSEEILIELNNKADAIIVKMRAISQELHEIRLMHSEKLEKEIKEELSYVGLEKARINIEVEEKSDFNSRGFDEVTFMVSMNPGEPLKQLEKVLSGGELSRIMLALKCVFVGKDKIPTLIFDEIDTGISGTIAKRVGEKMYRVSLNHQVLCITHLPQIAALSDCHYFVSKKVENDSTFTQIRTLDKYDKIKEIANMVAGDEVSEVSLENASEIVTFANLKKEELRRIYN
ncbi:MAG: DNA repair protein RecN [Clostridium sp.]